MSSADPPGSLLVTEAIQPPGFTNGQGVSSAANGHGFVYRHAKTAVLWAMGFNFTIALLKLLVACYVTRSAALFSEGLHSLADGVNSISLWVGIRQGSRAPDRTHPFGYGLETNLWALLASFVLFLSSLWAIFEGFHRMTHPVEMGNALWAIIILIVSLVLELFAVITAAYAVLEEVAIQAPPLQVIPLAFKHVRQVMAPTTRFVLYEDTLAFVGAFVALIAIVVSQIGVVQGWFPSEYGHTPDAIASIIIGLLMLGLSINLFRYNRGFLTGSAASANVETQIRTLVQALHGVSEVSDLKTIDHGLSGLMVHLKLQVEPETMVKDVDDLIERVKIRLLKRMPVVREVFVEVLADETEENWEDQFSALIRQGESKGILNPRESLMLYNLYDFTHSVVRDVMVPRTDVEAVEINASLADVAALILESGHSRIPVYEETIDTMVGMVHAHDIFEALQQEDPAPLRDWVREIDIYPENKRISDLLEDFKRKKIHLAAVADEHGGFSGLVTVEDLLEEIVGELRDEDEEEELELSLLSPTRLLVNGRYEVEELNERFHLNFPTEEFKTIGGYVFGALGREPELQDVVVFEDLTLTVQAVEGPRIETVLIDSPVPFEESDIPSLDHPVDSPATSGD